MKIFRNPSQRKLQSICSKYDMSDSTILHFTGSMWGIGAKLSSITAIERIHKLKQRENAGLIVLVPDIGWFSQNGIEVPNRLESLFHQYFPGNLSVAFRCVDERFSHVAVNGKVAFRVPIDPLLRAFIDALGEPIVSTSVNISSLPAEKDVSRISKHYETWFDFALFPSNKIINEGGEASTLIEYFEKSQDDIEHIRCLREGSIPFYDIKKSFELPLVMFVCTANICRSPIAEKLFNSMLKEHSFKLSTDSSGLLEGGHMISLNSMQLLMERGISEAQGHVSKQISKQMIDSSWLVLTMEEKQRDFLREVHPNTNHKILTLNEITGYEGDIKDPYGSDLDSYRKTFGIIEDRLQVLLEKIINNEFSM